MPRGSLEGYTPEKMKDGTEPIKGEVVCQVNKAELVDYDGPSDYSGKYVSIELEVKSEEFEGRRLWKKFWIEDDTPDKKGKTNIHKLADYLKSADTVLTGTTDEEIKKALAEFSMLTLLVKGYGFKGDDDKFVQLHLIKGLASDDQKSEATPF